MSVLIFLVQYVVMKYIFQKLNNNQDRKINNIGNSILICDINVMIFSLIVLFIYSGLEKYLLFFNLIIGTLLFFYLIKEDYSKKIVYLETGVKFLFYLVISIFLYL